MIDKIQELIKEVEDFSSKKIEEIDQFRIKFLSKKSGIVTDLFKEFKNVPKDEKKEFGQVLNILKNKVQDKVESLKINAKDESSANIQSFVSNYFCSVHWFL